MMANAHYVQKTALNAKVQPNVANVKTDTSLTVFLNAKSAMIHAKHAMEQQPTIVMNALMATTTTTDSADNAIQIAKNVTEIEITVHHVKTANTLIRQLSHATTVTLNARHAMVLTNVKLALMDTPGNMKMTNVKNAIQNAATAHILVMDGTMNSFVQHAL